MKVTVEFKYRDCTTAELAGFYGVSERSMRDFLRKHRDKIGKKEGRWWHVKQVIKVTEIRGPIGAIMKDEIELD